jgi:hypothetical protein
MGVEGPEIAGMRGRCVPAKLCRWEGFSLHRMYFSQR